MKTVERYDMGDVYLRVEIQNNLLGLIAEPDFDHGELYGFEVDLEGRPLIPELCPRPESSTQPDYDRR